MLRTALTAIATLIATALPVALGHDVVYRDLGGRALCIDPESIVVLVDDDRFAQAAAFAEATRELLGAALRAKLDDAGIPFRERERCRTVAARLGFTLQRATDERDRPYHWVLAELQIGRPTEGYAFGEDLPDLRFAALVADALHPPGSGTAYYAGLTGYPGELIDDLVETWWLDLETNPPTPRWLPFVGAALALAVSGAILLWARRRRIGR